MCKGKWASYEDEFVPCCINFSRDGHDIRTRPQREIIESPAGPSGRVKMGIR